MGPVRAQTRRNLVVGLAMRRLRVNSEQFSEASVSHEYERKYDYTIDDNNSRCTERRHEARITRISETKVHLNLRSIHSAIPRAPRFAN